MAWQIRRTNEADSSDVVQPGTHPTAALAYDDAMDNAVTWGKILLTGDPNVRGFKIKFWRDNIGIKGFRVVLTTTVGDTVVWTIEEV